MSRPLTSLIRAAEAAADGEAPGGAGGPAGPDGSPRGGELSWYGDSAHGTGGLHDAIGKAGHRAVIKPKPLQAPFKGGFTADDFAADEQAGTVTCPAGVTRLIPPRRHVVFGAACRACPLHYLQVRAGPEPDPARPATARRPRGLGNRPPDA